jgi:hypothetical protein
MTILSEHRSIVAVHPAGNSLTYVFFEDGRLTDWQRIEKNGEGDVLAILDRVLDGCAADVLILEDADATGCKRSPVMRILLKRMAVHARGRGFLVRLVSASDVRLAWRAKGQRNKQAVAATLAQQFPELQHLVPPPRRNFMNEDARVHIFDAVSLVLRYDETLPAELLP